MDLKLAGHTAVVTGGGSGIGLAAAEAFAAEGCGVALWDVSPTVTEVAADLARRFNVPATGVRVDVTDFEAVRSAAGQLSAVDHVVHCAAVGSGKFGFPFTNLSPADWPRSLEINVMGMVNVAHAFAPAMAAAGRGTFVFLASVAGQIGSQTDPPYSAAKAANINFAQCMAKDLAPHGVRVNTVCPGMVQTPLNRSVWQAWHDQQPEAERLTYEEWAGRKVKTIVPLGRWQSPADIADTIVFLSSERAAQVTGQTINVDGGFVMHW
ncbi:SDR family NAD(P)-dependent oxidoreductase [Limnoglobus roseus]|uniref:NAD(P)-dependent oxidoreductase n=1 Tax=Limnoglobus roseus TaxID=2598579 RepID=A0A5C1A8K5_9BACT|nr:SDR family oxidoreductase [Limnoglobus roseus]QEL15080.1 NAD(P)-dependent oxidoreductase [Limnoglobus roseus]